MSAAPDHLTGMLARLGLEVMRDRLDNLLDEVSRRDLSVRDALDLLCEAEVRHREERRIQMGLGIAKFPFVRTLDGFDFDAQPLPRSQAGPRPCHLSVGRQRRCLASSWPARRQQESSRLRSGAGGGEARLHRAVRAGDGAPDSPDHAGQGPRRRAARREVCLLRQAQAADRRRAGYLPFDQNAAHLFFQLVSRRYERGSLLVTSNRSVGEWGTVFRDPVVATAILDRLLHHSHVITIRGHSYRLREKRRAGLIKTIQLEQQLAKEP